MTDHDAIARTFLYAALLILIVGGLIGLATHANPRPQKSRETLLTMLGVFGLLPVLMAFPFAESLPDTGYVNAWWEMVSSLTTTGASLYSADLLPEPLHLWRAMVGWMGGFFILVAAVAILAPLRVGGFEIMASPSGREEYRERLPKSSDPRTVQPHLSDPVYDSPLADPALRLLRAGAEVGPIYLVLTLVLWVGLLLLGDPSFLALTRAMGTLSTSGISPVVGPPGEVSASPERCWSSSSSCPRCRGASGRAGPSCAPPTSCATIPNCAWPSGWSRW